MKKYLIATGIAFVCVSYSMLVPAPPPGKSLTQVAAEEAYAFAEHLCEECDCRLRSTGETIEDILELLKGDLP